MLPAVALPPPAPAPGEAWITTLDVGQGLAVLVRTANRALLYDAGPAFGADADSGERIIAPYLRATGIERLDAMVVTHNDIDHSGGAASVVGNFEVDALLSFAAGGPSAARHRGRRAALRGRAVLGLGRRALRSPASGERGGAREEEQRPELRAESERGRALDAAHRRHREAGGSGTASARDAAALAADVLLVPHHGSRTSSSAGVPRRRAPVGGGRSGGLPQPLRPSERGGRRALPRCRHRHLAHRPGGRRDGSSGGRRFHDHQSTARNPRYWQDAAP